MNTDELVNKINIKELCDICHMKNSEYIDIINKGTTYQHHMNMCPDCFDMWIDNSGGTIS